MAGDKIYGGFQQQRAIGDKWIHLGRRSPGRGMKPVLRKRTDEPTSFSAYFGAKTGDVCGAREPKFSRFLFRLLIGTTNRTEPVNPVSVSRRQTKSVRRRRRRRPCSRRIKRDRERGRRFIKIKPPSLILSLPPLIN